MPCNPEAPLSESSYQSLAYERIRNDIVHCRLVPGQKLSAKMLEDSLGVGRTPIRESLVRLSELGLVYTVPQSGTFVSKIDMATAEDARYVREHLEKRIAIECSACINDEQLAEMREILEKQEAAICENDDEAFFDLDNAFHESMFTVANRHEVWNWISAFDVDLERYRWLRNQVKALDWEIIMSQHRKMFRALCSHDTEEISYMSTLHLHLMIAEQDTVIEAFPDYFVNTPQRSSDDPL